MQGMTVSIVPTIYHTIPYHITPYCPNAQPSIAQHTIPYDSVAEDISEHDLEVDMHEVLAFRGARQGDVDALLQPPPEGLINVPGKVGGRQHHDLHVLHQSPLTGKRKEQKKGYAFQ